MRPTLLLTLFLVTPSALAGSGQLNAFGPYDVNPAITTGEAAGFRQLFVDPARIGEMIAPAEAMGESADDVLHVQNRSSAWTELSISGVRIGIIGPLTTVSLENVQPGSYETSCLGPTGMTVVRTLASERFDELKAAATEIVRLEGEAAAQEAEAAEGEDTEGKGSTE